MVKDHSDSERGNPLPPHGLLFPINSKGYSIYTIPHGRRLRPIRAVRLGYIATTGSFCCSRGMCIQGRKEMFYLTTHYNTFYLRLYVVRHMVKDHSDSERGNPLPPHRLQSWSTGWNVHSWQSDTGMKGLSFYLTTH